MQFTLNITKTDGAAFGENDEDECQEIARILKEVANDLALGHNYGNCEDANGKTVGEWRRGDCGNRHTGSGG